MFKEELEDGAVAAVGRHQGGRDGGGVGGPVGVDLALLEENLDQLDKSLVAASLEQCVAAWEAPERTWGDISAKLVILICLKFHGAKGLVNLPVEFGRVQLEQEGFELVKIPRRDLPRNS